MHLGGTAGSISVGPLHGNYPKGAPLVSDSTLIRILYMEDDPGLAHLLQKILQRRGFVIDIVANGTDTFHLSQ